MNETLFYRLLNCYKANFGLLTTRQPLLPEINQLLSRSLITRLGPKARPSTSVGFKPVTFWFRRNVLSHCVTQSKLQLTLSMMNIYTNFNLKPLPKFRNNSSSTQIQDILTWKIYDMIKKTTRLNTRKKSKALP